MTRTCRHWKTWKDQKKKKKYNAQGFYIEKKFECLYVVTLGDGGVIFSSFSSTTIIIYVW
jgi:hypothetical protein